MLHQNILLHRFPPKLTRSSLISGALAWNADQLSSGSRDRMILQRDVRTPPQQSERRLQGHRQEVCGLKWSTDHQLLASGGNDNKVTHNCRAGPLTTLDGARDKVL